MPRTSGFLIVQQQGDKGILVTSELNPLPPDPTYQLSLHKDDMPLVGGVFRSDGVGWGYELFSLPIPFTRHSGTEVTVERIRGSIMPTGPTVLFADINPE